MVTHYGNSVCEGSSPYQLKMAAPAEVSKKNALTFEHYSITLWACLSQVHRTHTLHMQLPQAVDEVLTNSRKIHTRATLLSSGTNHKNLEHVVKNRERMRRIYNTSLQPGRPWPYIRTPRQIIDACGYEETFIALALRT